MLNNKCLCAGKLLALSMLLLSSSVFAGKTISGSKDMQRALESAVLCKREALSVFDGSEFDGALDDVQSDLKSLGVDIRNSPEHGGAIRYRLPPGTKVFGLNAIEALYFSESTTLFFVEMEANLKALMKLKDSLKLKAISRQNAEGYGYFDEFEVLYFRKLLKGAHNGLPEDTIIAGVGRRNGNEVVVLGCQNLAW